MEAILFFFYIFVNLPLLPQLHLQNSKLLLRPWKGELRVNCQKDKKMTFATILEKSWEDDRKTSNRPLVCAEISETAAKQSRLRDTSDAGIGFPERSL